MESFSDMDELDEIIRLLSLPVSEQEREFHWTNKSKEGILGFFTQLRSDVSASKTNPAINGLIRGLDSWGVSSGVLYERCLEVNLKLRDAGFAG